MIEFQPLTLHSLPLVRPFLQEKQSLLSNYSPGALMMWRDWVHLEGAIQGDTLFLRAKFEHPWYFPPLGGDLSAGFSQLEAMARAEDGVLRLTCLDARDRDLVLARYPGGTVEGPGVWGDYVYDADALRRLPGKPYEKKRNFVNRFKKTYPDWHSEPVTAQNLEEVKALFRRLCDTHEAGEESRMFYAEQTKVWEVLNNYALYGMTGCALYAGESMVGFGLGEILGDVAFEHIEKADVSYVGAYQMLVTTFANQCVPESVQYINREDDAQDAGLRKSKLSYHPVFLTEKYDVEVVLE